MSTNRGIFDSFPSQPTKKADSPFAVAGEGEKESAPASPFAPAARQESPFTVVDDAAPAEAAPPVKLPDPRKEESPFQMAEQAEGFGFEAPAFEPSPLSSASSAPASTPFGQPQTPEPARPTEPVSPFAVDPGSTSPSDTPFGTPVVAKESPDPAPRSTPQAPPAQAFPPPTQVPAAFAAEPFAAAGTPAPEPTADAPAPTDDSQSDSFSIRQLELRAIFGVDREMGGEEILQRSRALPGIRNIARLAPNDMATIDSMKSLVANLGFGGGSLKLYSGSVPIDFIREGSVLLAVQTDGGFAPGVRETLMIVARELNRLG